MTVEREEADFDSRGTRCAAWLYRPADNPSPPVVLMAHGLGLERRFGLPEVAERFADRGLATFLFDHRHLGDSEGRPRGLIDPYRQARDWRAALSHVRSLPDLDRDRIALWGTSYSGGHVLRTSALDGNVAAVVAQTPMASGLRTELGLLRGAGLGWGLRVGVAALRDGLRAVVGREPYSIPVAGDPGQVAVLTTPESMPGYRSLVPDDAGWANRCPARVVLVTLPYRPVASAGSIDCPVLVVQADRDSIISAASVEALVRRLRDVEHVRVPGGHFDVYSGETFDRVVEREGAFLETHLLERGRPDAT